MRSLALGLLAFFLLLFFLFIFLPLEVRFRYRHWQERSQVSFQALALFGLIRLGWASGSGCWTITLCAQVFTFRICPRCYRRRARFRWKPGEFVTFSSRLVKNKDLIGQALLSLLRVLKRIRFKQLQLQVEIGTGDAAETGIATGMLWSSLGLLSHLFSRRGGLFSAKKKELTIIPNFQERVLNLDAAGILLLRPGHIIIVLAKFVGFLVWYRIYRERGEITWGNILSRV